MTYQIQSQLKQNIELLHISTAQATLCLSLFGGQVLSYRPSDGRERLWLSEQSSYDGVKAIRGGIPVCWPWFGHNETDSNQPAHGLVRTVNWSLTQHNFEQEQLILTLQPQGLDNCPLDVKMTITLGQSLSIRLCTTNHSRRPRPFNCALHNYFAVDDIHTTRIQGLYGQYQNKRKLNTLHTTEVPYIITRETDNVHLCTAEQINIEQGVNNTGLRAKGHDSYVVWNPWKDKSHSMADMDPSGYTTMLCVESAITQRHVLLPGESHTLAQDIL